MFSIISSSSFFLLLCASLHVPQMREMVESWLPLQDEKKEAKEERNKIVSCLKDRIKAHVRSKIPESSDITEANIK